MPIELANDRRILAPVRLDLDHKFQKDFGSKYGFEFQASLRSDFLDGGAALSDQNSLLAFALDVNSGAYTRQFLGFLEIVNQHGDGVRDFFPSDQDCFFANEFGGDKPLGLVGKLIGWKMRRRFGKPREPGVYQVKAAGAGERGDGKNLREVEYFVVALDHRQEKLFVDAVHFIQQEINRAVKSFDPLNREAVARAEIGGGVNDERKYVDALQRVQQFIHHHAAQNIFGPVNAGRIYEDDLRVVTIQNALNAVASGLRLRRNDSDFLADQRVYKRGLARIRAANNRDESGLERHADNNCTPSGLLRVVSRAGERSAGHDEVFFQRFS